MIRILAVIAALVCAVPALAQPLPAKLDKANAIVIDTTKGREKVHIWGLNGTQEILVDSTAAAEQIRLTDKAGQVVRMN